SRHDGESHSAVRGKDLPNSEERLARQPQIDNSRSEELIREWESGRDLGRDSQSPGALNTKSCRGASSVGRKSKVDGGFGKSRAETVWVWKHPFAARGLGLRVDGREVWQAEEPGPRPHRRKLE